MDEGIELLDEISGIKSNSKVLITSFKYNQYFFEKHVFPHFKDKTFPILLIDYNEHQKNILESSKSKYAETKYFIEPVNVKGAFHPKLFLCVSDEEVIFLIGSNNLTPQGYSTNIELINHIVINLKDSEISYLLNDLIEVLGNIKEVVVSEPHKREIDKILQKIPSSKANKRDMWILSNIKKGLLNQIQDIVKEDIVSIKVLCPYFSEEKRFYEDILELGKKIEIIIQNKTNNLPKDKLKGLENIGYNEIKLSDNRFLHSKLIMFKTKKWEYLLSGSANFSVPALSLPCSKGNVEICMLSKVEIGTFDKLVSDIGKVHPIELNKIESTSINEDISENISDGSSYRILEASIKDNKIIIKIDKNIGISDVKLILDTLGKEYITKSNGEIIILEIPKEDIPLFDKTSALKIIVGSNHSDYKLIHNPSFFPEQYSMLNSLVSDDADWLFSLLNKLSKMPNFSQYIPILDKLEEYGIFDAGIDREGLLLKLKNKLASIKPYSTSERLKEVIDRFVSRHEKRIANATKYNEYKNAKQVISSFLMINKLILWSIKNKYDDISGLRNIKGNLEDFCGKDEKGYLTIIEKNDLMELVKESNLIYHLILLTFIIDLLQSKSPEITRTHLSYSPLKRVFETSNIICLSILFRLLDYKSIELNKVEEIKKEYENIVPEIKDHPCKDILIRINNLISEVNRCDYKKYHLIE